MFGRCFQGLLASSPEALCMYASYYTDDNRVHDWKGWLMNSKKLKKLCVDFSGQMICQDIRKLVKMESRQLNDVSLRFGQRISNNSMKTAFEKRKLI